MAVAFTDQPAHTHFLSQQVLGGGTCRCVWNVGGCTGFWHEVGCFVGTRTWVAWCAVVGRGVRVPRGPSVSSFGVAWRACPDVPRNQRCLELDFPRGFSIFFPLPRHERARV